MTATKPRLKVVETPAAKPARRRYPDLPVMAQIVLRKPRPYNVRTLRRYVNLRTAVGKLEPWLMEFGEVGDYVEITNTLHGNKWLATIKITGPGKSSRQYWTDSKDWT